MRIVFLASGAFALPTLRWLGQSEHEVPLVVSQPPRPRGRGRKTASTPVAAAARDLGIRVIEANDVNSAEMVAELRSHSARLGLVIAFGQKLGQEVCDCFPGGCVNLHASLLPKYRGAAPINWAIINGEERTGCTVFQIVERMDAGPIFITRGTEIQPEETTGELHDRLAGIGVDAVQAAFELFQGDESPRGKPQDDALATPAPKLKKSDGAVRFDRPAAQVVNHVHGMTPWPGASAEYQGTDGRREKVLLTRVRLAERSPTPTIAPGTVDERLFVALSDGFLEILQIKPSSGKVMSWQEFVNGRHVRAGDILQPPTGE